MTRSGPEFSQHVAVIALPWTVLAVGILWRLIRGVFSRRRKSYLPV